jgi:hypothetical protein
MSVHVGEIHTEVTTTAAPAESGSGPAGERTPPAPGAVVDRWRQTGAEASRLACRVAAEGFDD